MPDRQHYWPPRGPEPVAASAALFGNFAILAKAARRADWLYLTVAMQNGIVYLSGSLNGRRSGSDFSRCRRPFEHGLGDQVVADRPGLAGGGVEAVAQDSAQGR